jgi:hypothetical protein
LQLEATKQIAIAYRQSGQLSRAAGEYDRISSQSDDPALRSEALLVAETSTSNPMPGSRVGCVHPLRQRVSRPVETALETRFKIAEMYKAAHDESLYHQRAGGNRTHRRRRRTGKNRPDRTLAARSALVLAEQLYRGASLL